MYKGGPHLILRWPWDCAVKNKYLSEDSNRTRGWRTRCWHTVTLALFLGGLGLDEMPSPNCWFEYVGPCHTTSQEGRYGNTLAAWTLNLCYFQKCWDFQIYLFPTTKICEGKWKNLKNFLVYLKFRHGIFNLKYYFFEHWNHWTCHCSPIVSKMESFVSRK